MNATNWLRSTNTMNGFYFYLLLCIVQGWGASVATTVITQQDIVRTRDAAAPNAIPQVSTLWPPKHPDDLIKLIEIRAPHPWIQNTRDDDHVELQRMTKTKTISDSCYDQLHSFNFYKHLVPAYADFAKLNSRCIQSKVEPCWDSKYHKWTQGTCSVKCDNRIDRLAEACRLAGGELCQGNYFAGISGTALEFFIPSCNPKNCTNREDNHVMNTALMNATCNRLPSILLSECLVEEKCFAENTLAIHILIYSAVCVISLVGVLVVSLRFQIFTKVCNSRKSYNRQSTGKILLRRSDSLRESIFSPLMGVTSVQTTNEDSFTIVEGTPRPLDESRISPVLPEPFALESLDQLSTIHEGTTDTHGTENNSFQVQCGRNESLDVNETTGHQERPKYRLSRALLQHVRQGLTADQVSSSTSGNQASQLDHAPKLRGHSLIWRNLYYKRQGIQVLKGVTGYIAPGMVVALIGAPDSGTTSLLKVLAGRTVDGGVVGDLLVNGKPPDHTLSNKVGYIPKEDINLPCLTVRETLDFSFALRAKQGTPKHIREDRVDAALQLLGLAHVADTIVGDGNLIRGISGGERRRVSLGVEAVVNRTILLADSPTNGLDSGAAYDVIKTARAMADTRLVSMMCSIRQPSPELFLLFDTCCLISRGSCIFFGSSSSVISHFNSLGYRVPASKSAPDFLEAMTFDASEFYVGEGTAGYDSEEQTTTGNEISNESGYSHNQQQETIVGDDDDEPLQQLRRLRRPSQARVSLEHAYRTSTLYEQLGMQIWRQIDEATLHEAQREELFETTESDPWRYLGDDELEMDEDEQLEESTARRVWKLLFTNDKYVTGFWHQFVVCVVRQAKITTRSPTSLTKIGSKVFLGILLGTLFGELQHTQEGATNRFGLLFLVTSAVMMGSLSVIPQLFTERVMFYHQKSAGYFRGSVYYACVFVVELPVMCTQALALSLLVYPLCGLQGGIMSWNFVYFVATLLVLEFGSWSICMLGVMLCPSVVVATSVVPVVMAVMLLFSGFLVPREALPQGMIWLNKVSLMSGPFKGLAINEVTGLVYSCKPDELVPQPNYPGFNLPPPDGFWGPAYQTCPLASGSLSLMMYDLQTGEQNKWVLLFTSLIYILGINIVLIVVVALVNFSTDSSDAAVTSAQSRKRQLRKLKQLVVSDGSNTHSEGFRGNTNHSRARVEQTSSSLNSHTNQEIGSVEFENLNYSVDTPNGEKQLLFDVSGYVKPGTLMALMGSSGAGKSTLLDVLADKKTGGKFSADTLLVNGKPRDKYLARKAGYVEQMDSHLPTITVREAVETSAILRLPASVSAEQRSKRVEDVLERLMLKPFQNHLVGVAGQNGALAGVSPEVRKKVTIAVELVFDPPLMFLDEPTTSLSSAEALAVMTTLKRACADKAVMCTIHQPSSEVFELFDWILLLQTGGRVAFFGPLDAMGSYFESQGMGSCPEGKNPADFALDCSRASGPLGEEAWELYETSSWKQEVLALAPRFQQDEEGVGTRTSEDFTYHSKYAVGFWVQFWQILKVQLRYYLRDTPLLVTRCVSAVIFGIIIGSLYFQMDHGQAGAKSRIGLMFISCVYSGLSGILSIPKVIELRAVHYREYTSSMYRLPAYYLAVAIAELPFIVMQVALFVVIFYPLTGLRGGSHFVSYFAVVLLTGVTCFAFSSLLASLAPNADTAVIVNSLLNSVFTLFCGFLVPYKSIPLMWRFAYYISFYRYPLGFLVANELSEADFNCGPNGDQGSFPVYVGGATNSSPPFPYGTGMPNPHCLLVGKDYTKLLNDPTCFRYYCPVIKGDALLHQFSFPMDTEAMVGNLFVLAGMYAVIRLLGFLALKYVVYIKR